MKESYFMIGQIWLATTPSGDGLLPPMHFAIGLICTAIYFFLEWRGNRAARG